MYVYLPMWISPHVGTVHAVPHLFKTPDDRHSTTLDAATLFEVTYPRTIEHNGIGYFAVSVIGGRSGFIMARHFGKPYMVHLE